NGTLTIAQNTASANITVLVPTDQLREANQSVRVFLTLPAGTTGVTLLKAVGNGLIVDDDGVSLAVGDPNLGEGNTGTATMQFPVMITNPIFAAPQTPVTALINTSNLPATAGLDYTALVDQALPGGQFPFSTPGNLITSINIPVTVFGDSLLEGDEKFRLTLSSVNGADAGRATGTGTIVDDDDLALTIGDVTRREGSGGTTIFTFPVYLNAATT